MVEKLGELEVYDVENPDINPEQPGVQTYDVEQPKKYSKWERVKGYVGNKVETYRAERAVLKKIKREERLQRRHEEAGQRFQARVDRVRQPQPSSGFNKSAATQMRGSVFGGLSSFGMQPRASGMSAPSKSFRTKTVYKKVGKHYKKVTSRIAIKPKNSLSTIKAKQNNLFGGMNNFLGGDKQSSGLNLGAFGQQPKSTGKKKSKNGFTGFRIGF